MIRSILHRLPRPNFRATLGLIAALLLATAWFVAPRPTYLGGWTMVRVAGAGHVLALLLSASWLGTLAGTLAASSVLTAGSPTGRPDAPASRRAFQRGIGG